MEPISGDAPATDPRGAVRAAAALAATRRAWRPFALAFAAYLERVEAYPRQFAAIATLGIGREDVVAMQDALAARPADQAAMRRPGTMDLGRAMEIVYELAQQNALDPERLEDAELAPHAAEHQEALAVVHDFIVNQLADD